MPASKGEKISLSKVMRVEAVNKEMRHRTGAALGRALIGGTVGWLTLSGPVGALLGFVTTNHQSNVTFEAKLEGGRRLLATADTTTYTKLVAAAFDYKPPEERGVPVAPPPPEWLDRMSPEQVKFVPPFLLGFFILIGIANRSPLAWGMGQGCRCGSPHLGQYNPFKSWIGRSRHIFITAGSAALIGCHAANHFSYAPSAHPQTTTPFAFQQLPAHVNSVRRSSRVPTKNLVLQ